MKKLFIFFIIINYFQSDTCYADSTTVQICYNGEIGFPDYKTISKEINRYDSAGRLIQNETYNFEYYSFAQGDTNFRLVLRTDYSYNSTGLIDSVLETHENNGNKFYFRFNYFYDLSGNLIEKDRFAGNVFPLDSNQRTTFQFDANNNLIQERKEQYVFPLSFWTTVLTNWIYDVQDRLIKYQKINYQSNLPHDSASTFYSYSATNKLLSILEFGYGTFIDSNYYAYVYDINDSLFSYTIYNNTLGNSWIPFQTYHYYYASTSVTQYFCNCPDSTCSDSINRQITVYDLSGRVVSHTRADYDSGLWETTYDYTYAYDSNGNVIDYYTHSLGGGYEQNTYDYNSSNDLIHSYTESVHHSYFYNDCYYYNLDTDSMLVLIDYSDTLCSGSFVPIAITMEGGQPPYQYDWTPGNFLTDSTILNPVLLHLDSTTSYQLSVTDFNGITKSDSISFFAMPDLFVPVSINNIGFPCENNAFNLTYDPILTNYSPRWKGPGGNQLFGDTIFAAVSGLYNLILRDTNNCPYYYSTTINLFSQPFISLGSDTNICIDDTISLHGGNFAQYNWSTGETLSTIEIFSAVQNSDTISVLVTDNNDCYNSDTIVVNSQICLSVQEEINTGIFVTVYDEMLYVDLPPQINSAELLIVDLSGRIILKSKIDHDQFINVSMLEHGVYVYSFDNRFSGKILKK